VTGSAPLRATRRRLLGTPAAVVAAGLAVAGCDLAESEEPGTSTSPSGPTSPSATTPSPAADPDEALVARVRGDLAEAAALVAAAGSGRRELRRELAPFGRLHVRHLAALPGEDPQVVPVQVRGSTAAARRRVRLREENLQVALADEAVEASSGPLAALLASMSAAVAQQLAASEESA